MESGPSQSILPQSPAGVESNRNSGGIGLDNRVNVSCPARLKSKVGTALPKFPYPFILIADAAGEAAGSVLNHANDL